MRPSSISIENIFSLLTKTKNVRGFNKKIVDLQSLMKIEFCLRQIFEILIIPLGSCEVPHKGPIDTPVFTFIGYKQTD